ncbi:hypothetical protein [Halorussus amylolyticus]|uniref:hypothetical protein n=1 Tax=Halorussus amylolyticus TaxID=1126242 RepID=UPI00104312D8|nr:hypothetical protein [Halorussus amylolyticus]
MTTASHWQWKRIVAGGVAPHAISVGVLVVAIVGYTVVASFVALGEPDQAAFGQWNAVLATWVFPALTILLTAAAAAWVVRSVEPQAALAHGFAVGLLAAGIGLAFGAADSAMALRFVGTVAAGLVGAKLGTVIRP